MMNGIHSTAHIREERRVKLGHQGDIKGGGNVLYLMVGGVKYMFVASFFCTRLVLMTS